MGILRIDIETFSDEDITEVGAYKYVDSPRFEILMIAYKYCNDDGACIGRGLIDFKIPKDTDGIEIEWIKKLLSDMRTKKVAFNANFERICLNKHFGLNNGAHEWYCTMVKALTLGLPGSLAEVGRVLNIEEDKQKLKTGKALIDYFCKPKDPGKNGGRSRNLPSDDLLKWESFKQYCLGDVDAEEAIDQRLDEYYQPNNFERDLYILDQKINDLGMYMDLEFIGAAIKIDEASTAPIIDQMKKITGLQNPNSAAQLKGWIDERTDLNTTENGLNKDNIPQIIATTDSVEVKTVLELRQSTNNTSIAKYGKMRDVACTDDRIHGAHMFYGANKTGRWAGRLIQPQNMPRNYLKDIETVRDIAKLGSYRALEMLYEDPSDIIKQLIRTAIVAPKGSRLYITDFSAIEARVLAHEACERWRMEVFETHGKIYEASASQMFNVPLESIDKGGANYHMRATGKVAELALGYGGSKGALEAFGALDMGLNEQELKPIVDAWRKANPNIVSYWWEIGDAALEAVRNPGRSCSARGVTYRQEGSVLFAYLRSGARLAYVNPRIVSGNYGKDQIQFEGRDQTRGKWVKIYTYGPKLVENIIQRIARDCLGLAMLNLDAYGYKIVMHVHDEIIIECKDIPDPDRELYVINDVMSKRPPWAPGLPLRGDGFHTLFYMKD